MPTLPLQYAFSAHSAVYTHTVWRFLFFSWRYAYLLTCLSACPQVEQNLPVSQKQYVGAMEACMRQVRHAKTAATIQLQQTARRSWHRSRWLVRKAVRVCGCVCVCVSFIC